MLEVGKVLDASASYVVECTVWNIEDRIPERIRSFICTQDGIEDMDDSNESFQERAILANPNSDDPQRAINSTHQFETFSEITEGDDKNLIKPEGISNDAIQGSSSAFNCSNSEDTNVVPDEMMQNASFQTNDTDLHELERTSNETNQGSSSEVNCSNSEDTNVVPDEMMQNDLPRIVCKNEPNMEALEHSEHEVTQRCEPDIRYSDKSEDNIIMSSSPGIQNEGEIFEEGLIDYSSGINSDELLDTLESKENESNPVPLLFDSAEQLNSHSKMLHQEQQLTWAEQGSPTPSVTIPPISNQRSEYDAYIQRFMNNLMREWHTIALSDTDAWGTWTGISDIYEHGFRGKLMVDSFLLYLGILHHNPTPIGCVLYLAHSSQQGTHWRPHHIDGQTYNAMTFRVAETL